jgi:hypothetical protein
MRSIPVAMTLEIFRHGKWLLLLGLLGANVLPVLLLAALSQEGMLRPTDPHMLVMHIVLTQVSLFAFGMSVIAAQGPLARLYTYPVSSATIVAWRMLPAMLLVALEVIASTAALNAVFDLGWPLWGPALFAAAALALMQAALWLAEKTLWLPISIGAVAIVFGLWHKSRYGGLSGMPTHLWSTITPLEVLTLLLMAGVAAAIAVVAVGRNRRGDPLPELGIVAVLLRLFEDGPIGGRRFKSPAEAQFWCEWRRKGWAMPVCVAAGIVLGVGGWAFGSRNPGELLEGFVAGGALLSIGAVLCGLIIGNVGRSDESFDMGQFLGTRPLTNSELASCVLRVAAGSVLASWALWAIAFGVAYAGVKLFAAAPPALPEWAGWWLFPAALLGAWGVTTVAASVSLTGRARLVLFLSCAFFTALIAVPLLERHVLARSSRAEFREWLWALIGASFLVGTVWAFVRARRREVISRATAGLAWLAWIIVCGVAVAAFDAQAAAGVPLLLLAGLLSLTIGPIAAAPLALAWNRTR